MQRILEAWLLKRKSIVVADTFIVDTNTLSLLCFVLYFLGTAGAGVALTLLDSQANPSSRPSPVVAQLGTTYQTLSLSFWSCKASVTSCGFMAGVKMLVFGN